MEVASSHAFSAPAQTATVLIVSRTASAVVRTSRHCTNRSRHVRKETLDLLIQIIGRPHCPPMCELTWPSLDKCVACVADSGTGRSMKHFVLCTKPSLRQFVHSFFQRVICSLMWPSVGVVSMPTLPPSPSPSPSPSPPSVGTTVYLEPSMQLQSEAQLEHRKETNTH